MMEREIGGNPVTVRTVTANDITFEKDTSAHVVKVSYFSHTS